MKAFPNSAEYPIRNDGMDLRDYFAAKAMQALIRDWSDCRKDTAERAYEMADAMMKEREK